MHPFNPQSMNNEISKDELEAIQLLSNSELVRLSTDIGEGMNRDSNQTSYLLYRVDEMIAGRVPGSRKVYDMAKGLNMDVLRLIPLAKAVCAELQRRRNTI